MRIIGFPTKKILEFAEVLHRFADEIEANPLAVSRIRHDIEIPESIPQDEGIVHLQVKQYSWDLNISHVSDRFFTEESDEQDTVSQST